MSWDPLPWVESWEVALYGTDGVLFACPLPAHYRLFLKEARGGFPAGWTTWNETNFSTPWAAKTTDYSPELAEIAHTTFFEREAAAFLDAVRGRAPVPISAQHARDILRVIAACYVSSRQAGREQSLQASSSLLLSIDLPDPHPSLRHGPETIHLRKRTAWERRCLSLH